MSEENVAKEYFEKYIKDFEKRIGKNLTTEFNEHLKVLLSRAEKQQKEIEVLTLDLEEMEKSNNHKLENWVHKNILNSYISKDKIRERIKHNEEQRNNVVSVAKFKIDNDGITGEGIEGLNDLIVYKSYEAVINELNYLLKE